MPSSGGIRSSDRVGVNGGGRRRIGSSASESIKVVLLGDSGVGKSSLCLRFVTDEFKPYTESTIGASFMSKTMDVYDHDEDETVEGTRAGLEAEANSDAAGAHVDSAQSPDERIVNQLQNAGSWTARSTRAPLSPSSPSAAAAAAAAAATAGRPSRRSVTFKIWDTAGQEKYHSLASMYYRGAAAAILVYDICNRSTFDVLRQWVEELRIKGPEGVVLVVCGNKYDLHQMRQVRAEEAGQYAASVNAFYIETSARESTNVSAMFREIGRKVPRPDDSHVRLEGSLGHVNLGYAEERTKRCNC